MADIDVAREGSVAVVTLNRPDRRNPISLGMWRGIATIVGELDRDPEVRAIVLTGAGGNFSVGADIAEFATVRDDAAQSVAYEQAVDAAADTIAAVTKPTIGVVSGYCLGGGCHLLLACDFRYADDSAVFGIPAANLSIVYGVRSTQRLLALVGLVEAKRILFSAERFGVEEAERCGLVDRRAEDAMAAALAFAGGLASKAPLSIGGTKAILNGLSLGAGALDLVAAQRLIDEASESGDYREGRNAFAEKRPPRFTGR